MIGGTIVLFFFVYIAIATKLVQVAIGWARARGRRPWVWGLMTGLALYNLVLWDWIPAMARQAYHCSREAGFWVYKTPEQWRVENPEVAGKLSYVETLDLDRDGNKRTYHLTERIDWVSDTTTLWPEVTRRELTLLDSKTKEVLARELYFHCGVCGRAPKSILDYRLWMNRCECALERRRAHGGFFVVKGQFKGIGDTR